MKRTLITACLGAVLTVVPASVGARIAQVQLVNTSVRMFPGDCSCGFGLVWTLSFSTYYTEDPAAANGELAPLPQPATFDYWSYLVLEDPSMFASTTYAELDLPLTADANGNGIPDFLDVEAAVAATSGGTYAVIWDPGYGLLSLNWMRAAGSRRGSCQLTMIDPILGPMGPFSHSFELVSHAGELTYTPGSNSVTGTIRFPNAGPSSEPLEGPVLLVKSPTNRFNLLTLSAGDWTNATQTFTFGDCGLARDPAHPTVYFGPLENSGGAYRNWMLTITDNNDADGNGIPDLSDDAVHTPLRSPVLSLFSAPTNLRLQVSGEVGHTCLLQQSTNLNSNAWQTVQSFALTNDPQNLTLSLPAETPAYWRVQVQ